MGGKEAAKYINIAFVALYHYNKSTEYNANQPEKKDIALKNYILHG